TPGPKFDAVPFVKLVTHSDMESSRQDGHVLRRRMIVGWNLVVRGHLQPHDIESALEGVPRYDGDLGALGKRRRRWPPVDAIGVDGGIAGECWGAHEHRQSE